MRSVTTATNVDAGVTHSPPRAYPPHMNPVVLAAAIGVSGTVIVGVAGFGAAIWNTRKTVANAHENRLWDQRATVYVDTIAAVNYRQVKRNHETNAPFPPDPDYDRRMEAYLSAYKPPDWHLLEARLVAFATESVVTAMQASSTAHERAMDARHAASQALRQSRNDAGYFTADDIWTAANAAAEAAAKTAEAADGAVIELIRRGLQGQSRPLSDWQPAPPPGLVNGAT